MERAFGEKKVTPRCPRCRSVRMQRRLDGSRFCERCGQRIAADGRLVPSADRRDGEHAEDGQLHLL
jgi:hypothetical protein